MMTEDLRSRLTAERRRFMVVGGSVGAALAFVATGVVGDLVKVAIGAAVGVGFALFAWAIVARQARGRRAAELQRLRKSDLEARARRLDVENPGGKTKAELADAIVARSAPADSTGELMIETVGALGQKVSDGVDHTRERLADRNTNGRH